MSDSDDVTQQTTFKRLFGYIKRVRVVFYVAILTNILYAALDIGFLTLIKPFTDKGLIPGDVEYMKMAPLFIILVIAFRGIAGVISTYCMGWVSQSVVQRMRQELFGSYLDLPTKFFDNNASGKLISKVTFNTQQVAHASSDTITKLVREGGSIFFAILFLFYENWRLASIYFISVPVIAILVHMTSKRFRKVSKKIQDAMGGVTQTTQEVVDGYKVVKTFNGEEYEKKRFHNIVNSNRQQNLKLILTKAISVPLIQLIASIAMAIVIFYAAFEIEKGQLSTGGFIAFFLVMVYIFKPLKVISNVNSLFQQGLAGAEDIFETIDSERERDCGTAALDANPKKIRFRNVDFAYETSEANVLEDINFELEQGQTVALVGRSGSGKSTITSLLLRFYDVKAGTIEFDGTDIEDFTLRSLRSNIGFVSQQVTLFNDSVAANIAYAEANVDQQKLLLAAKQAHALEFIEKLPQGFETPIGENGSRLSGGQRQRLAIARAIYKDAPMIILDEATSALDTESERYIQAALDALTKNRTTLVIAHRLSTIENADKIIVMQEGRIVESGNHQVLISNNSVYASLHAMQFSEE